MNAKNPSPALPKTEREQDLFPRIGGIEGVNLNESKRSIVVLKSRHKSRTKKILVR